MAKVSCRKGFTDALWAAAKEDKNIFAVATDSRGSVTMGPMYDDLPDQCVEVGIAEQNAVALAAGLALTGKKVFVSGPAAFVAARSYEQVKVDVAYNQTDVKIVGVSGGVSYGPLGGTHTALHDIASMRALPNIEVFIPSDAAEAAFITKYMVNTEGPAYMRTGRGDVELVYEDGEQFEIHKAKTVLEGDDVTIIACGEMVYFAKQAGLLLKEKGISARVLDLFCLKPADEEAIIKAAKETKGIVTVEEHSIYGGLGELVCHITAAHAPTRAKVLGFPDAEYNVGKNNELFSFYGLTPENIAAEAEKILKGE